MTLKGPKHEFQTTNHTVLQSTHHNTQYYYCHMKAKMWSAKIFHSKDQNSVCVIWLTDYNSYTVYIIDD